MFSLKAFILKLRVPYLPEASLGLQTTRLTHKDTLLGLCALNSDSSSTVYNEGKREPLYAYQYSTMHR